MAFLYQIKADGSPTAFWSIADKPLVLGRGDCADAFVDDDSLSRSHFLIVREGADFLLIDLHSSNGTWLNDKKVMAHKLQSNKVIRAGESVFYFSLAPITAEVFPIAAMSPENTVGADARLGAVRP